MPYFYDPRRNLNLLFIHIPKTGGTSIEKYFSEKYNIPLNRDSLWSTLRRGVTPNHLAFQHQPYSMLLKHQDFFKVHFTDNLKILAVVRNPYERIISDLFHFKFIDKNSSREEVTNAIKKYFVSDLIMLDNHKTPQHEFVTDEKGELIKGIQILKTESLNSDMYDLGYNDFNHFDQVNKTPVNYYCYLNAESIQSINYYYEKDFLLFGYKMKRI
jgi:hypothetical protein